jgi:hypothetical protein
MYTVRTSNSLVITSFFPLLVQDKDEGLRESLFYKIFGTTLIFETMSEMNAYREQCAKSKRNHATLLVVKEGIRCGSDGLLDPNSKLDYKAGRKIPFVFGSMPEGESSDAVQLAKACEHGSELLSSLKEYYAKEAEYQKFMHDHDTELTALEDMEKELRALNGIQEAKIQKKKKARR